MGMPGQGGKRRDAFPCSGCGACCRLVGLVHPEMDRGDAGCVFLGDDMRCTIYDERPYFCNVLETWKRDHSDSVSWPDFVRANRKMCRAARELVRAIEGDGRDERQP